jgi:hypothetical protein
MYAGRTKHFGGSRLDNPTINVSHDVIFVKGIWFCFEYNIRTFSSFEKCVCSQVCCSRTDGLLAASLTLRHGPYLYVKPENTGFRRRVQLYCKWVTGCTHNGREWPTYGLRVSSVVTTHALSASLMTFKMLDRFLKLRFTSCQSMLPLPWIFSVLS